MKAKELKIAMNELGIEKFDFFESIGSTNDMAKDWLNAGKKGIYAAYAEEQSTGRGRSGRDWQSPRGASISLSLGLPGNFIDSQLGVLLPGIAGIACVNTILQQEGLEIDLKWPNDLLMGEKKVGGILIESEWRGQESFASVIGIGINIAADAVRHAADFAFPASYLEANSAGKVDKEALVLGITTEFLALVQNYEKDEIVASWNNLLAFRGDEVLFQISGDERLEGKIQQVDEEGRIVMLDQKGKEKRFAAGEIRLLPRNFDQGS